MVALKLKQPQELESPFEQKDSRLLPTPFTYGAVLVSRIISNECRLDASSYNVMNALNIVYKNSFGYIYLSGKDGLINTAYYPGRYKRIYTEVGNGIPFYLPSQLDEIYPKPTKYISQKTAFLMKDDYIKDKNLLLSRSGTIGKCAISSKTTIGKLFSDDVIRITFKKDYDLGYTYAFLNTEVGLTILQSNNYGAVIDHIEPEHLYNIPIPNAPIETRKKIHSLIFDSYSLRDLSNESIDKAEHILYSELHLPKLSKIEYSQYLGNAGFNNFIINANKLERRIDASYHLPVIEEVLKIIPKNAKEILRLGDKRISKDVVLPGRFKRVYVEKEKGLPFIGGKQLTTLGIDDVKYLAKSMLTEKFKYSSMIKTNDILVSARGTIGTCSLTPLHWEGALISDNIIKIIPADITTVGYVYCFLQSEIGKALILREVSGSVVDVIEPQNLRKIPIPMLKSEEAQKAINDHVLEANNLRYQAYQKEREAISIMNDLLLNR